MMILVISDSHGREDNIEKVFRKENFDAVIHLGDSHDRSDEIERLLFSVKPGIPIVFVKGNCDDFGEPGYKVVPYQGVRFLLTHGYREHVKEGFDVLSYEARKENCRYALFGHTHIPDLIEKNGVTMVNPGSISSPHQYPPEPSYLLIEIGKNHEVFFVHRFL